MGDRVVSNSRCEGQCLSCPWNGALHPAPHPVEVENKEGQVLAGWVQMCMEPRRCNCVTYSAKERES